jgi:predicted nucleic acid-binding protein
MEYFMGTARGRRVRKLVEEVTAECLVSAINIAEIYSKSIKTDGIARAEERRLFITSRCAIVEVDERMAVEAAKIDVEMKEKVKGWGLADSIVLATARNSSALILTGDEHFKGLANVEML